MREEYSFFSVGIPKLVDRRDIQIFFSSEERNFSCDEHGIRLATLIMIACSFLEKEILQKVLSDFEWGPKNKVHKEGLHRQFGWRNRDFVKQFWGGQRTLQIKIELELKSSLIGWMRTQAKHHVEILHALMEEPRCSFLFSMHMDSLFSLASCSYTDIKIGSYTPRPNDPLPWLEMFFAKLQGGVCLVEDIDPAQLALQSLLSVEGYSAYQDFCESLKEWGEFRVAKIDQQPHLLCNEKLLCLFDKKLHAIVQHHAAVFLSTSQLLITQHTEMKLHNNKDLLIFSKEGEILGRSNQDRSLRWPSKS